MDKFILNGNNIAIRTLHKPISKYFAPKTKAEVLVYFFKFGHETNLKGLI